MQLIEDFIVFQNSFFIMYKCKNETTTETNKKKYHSQDKTETVEYKAGYWEVFHWNCNFGKVLLEIYDISGSHGIETSLFYVSLFFILLTFRIHTYFQEGIIHKGRNCPYYE